MRGEYLRYTHEPNKKLLVISDPFDYGGGKTVVMCRTCERAKSKRQTGIYETAGLATWKEPEAKKRTEKEATP